jgi:glycosyltransferase involved in cell wall biosynthesis
MKTEILKFKLLKLKDIINKQGLKGAFYFLSGKIKKRIHQKKFYNQLIHGGKIDSKLNQVILTEIQKLGYKPLISIIMPVYNVDEIWLRKAIDSVISQIYGQWELCIANDASTHDYIRPILDEYAALDKRIKVVHRESCGNISAASNSALSMATGEFIGLLDHDDEITSDALFEVVKLLNQTPDADLIYSDEDKIDERNKVFNPWFKPDWSPEYLLTHMYVCHFSVYRKNILNAVGGFRSQFDGAQDYDLCLRVTEKTKSIYHIPKILYHWRTISTSTALNPTAKLYAYEAGRKAVEEHLKRVFGRGTASFTDYYGVYKVNHEPAGTPLVSIIIPSAGKETSIKNENTCLLLNCLRSIRELSTYKNVEIIIVDGADIDESVIHECNSLGVSWVHIAKKFNFSERINAGVKVSKGEYLIFLNDDTEIITPNWIEEMLGFAEQPEIGAVGAKLITETRQVQHAGIIINDAAPGHIYYGIPDLGQGYFNALAAYKNYIAVTGACLMVSRKKFDDVGMMDESFPVNFNDVDLCLKLHQMGYRNVYNSHVVLYHFESVTRSKGYEAAELIRFRNKWMHYRAAIIDPYHHQVLFMFPALIQ